VEVHTEAAEPLLSYDGAVPDRLAELVKYDFSCTPDDTRRSAARIPGARVTIMPGTSP
jgi:hypothetical protein